MVDIVISMMFIWCCMTDNYMGISKLHINPGLGRIWAKGTWRSRLRVQTCDKIAAIRVEPVELFVSWVPWGKSGNPPGCSIRPYPAPMGLIENWAIKIRGKIVLIEFLLQFWTSPVHFRLTAQISKHQVDFAEKREAERVAKAHRAVTTLHRYVLQKHSRTIS